MKPIVNETHRGRNPSWMKHIVDIIVPFPFSRGKKEYRPEKAIRHMPYSILLETTRRGLSGMDDEVQPKGGKAIIVLPWNRTPFPVFENGVLYDHA